MPRVRQGRFAQTHHRDWPAVRYAVAARQGRASERQRLRRDG